MAAGDFNPEIWSGKILKNWDNVFDFMGVVNRNLEGEIRRAGDKLWALNLGDITVGTYAGSIAAYEAVPEAADDLDIDQQLYFAFKVGDLQAVQSKIELLNSYTKRAAIGIKNTVVPDLLGADIYGAAGLARSSTVAGDASAVLSAANLYDELNEIRQLHEDANTWMEGEMWASVPPVVMKFVRTSSELIHATEKGDMLIRDGKLTKLAGFNLIPVSASHLTGAGTAGAPYHCLTGNTESIHFAEQLNKIRSMDLENSFDRGISGLFVYGRKVFAQNANTLCDWTVQIV